MHRSVLYSKCVRMRHVMGTALLPMLLAGVCLACSMHIREAGFRGKRGGPYYPMQYRLIVIAEAETPETRKLSDALVEFEKAELAGSNLDIALFMADKTGPDHISAHDRELMKEGGVDLAKLPQTFLFVQDGFGRDIIFTENRLFTVEDVRDLAVSPAKKKLHGMLANNDYYCVVVLIGGGDKEMLSQAEKAVQAGIKACAPRLPPKQKIGFLRVDGSDRKEKRFLQELGFKAGSEPACAMIFGKGRMVMPMLRGAMISSEHIEQKLAFLRTDASDCRPDAVYLPGSVVDMIMPWSDTLDTQMHEAIARSGAIIPGQAWAEAEIDPNTGEIVDKPVK